MYFYTISLPYAIFIEEHNTSFSYIVIICYICFDSCSVNKPY